MKNLDTVDIVVNKQIEIHIRSAIKKDSMRCPLSCCPFLYGNKNFGNLSCEALGPYVSSANYFTTSLFRWHTSCFTFKYDFIILINRNRFHCNSISFYIDCSYFTNRCNCITKSYRFFKFKCLS